MTDTVDLSSYNLLICTPSFDGKVEETYQSSLDNTKALLSLHGAKIDVFKVKYVADIAFARSKLLGAFLRNERFTHMMFIDADMGWDAKDIAYMLMLQRDFIAAVGPKKIYPIEYAYQLIGDDSRPLPLYHELETNVAEIPYVGAAFMMLSRNCVEKMVRSYPELDYDMPDGEVEHALFDSIIINNPGNPRRRLSEDFSFCYRWRKIGGNVEVKMDVTLTHTGGHTFTGNLFEHFRRTESSFSQPPTVLKVVDGKAA